MVLESPDHPFRLVGPVLVWGDEFFEYVELFECFFKQLRGLVVQSFVFRCASVAGEELVPTGVGFSVRLSRPVWHRFTVDVVGSDCEHDEEVLGSEVTLDWEAACQVHVISQLIVGEFRD